MAFNKITEKECIRCRKVLPVQSYSFKNDSKDGFERKCRKCRQEIRSPNHDKLITTDLPNEEWRILNEFNASYAVSNLGRVKRVKAGRSTFENRILKPKQRGGYLLAALFWGNKRRYVGIHNLVARSFIGDCPRDWVVNHIDADKSNNRLDNLEYATKSQNSQHAWDSGLHPKIRKSPKKLSAKKTNEIKNLLEKENMSFRQISKITGVGDTTVSKIKKRMEK